MEGKKKKMGARNMGRKGGRVDGVWGVCVECVFFFFFHSSPRLGSGVWCVCVCERERERERGVVRARVRDARVLLHHTPGMRAGCGGVL